MAPRNHFSTSPYTANAPAAGSSNRHSSLREHGRTAYPPSPDHSTSSTARRQRTYSHTPPSPLATNGVIIDPLLAFHSHTSNLVLEYDVALPPSQIVRRNPSSSALTSRDYATPATSPPLPYLYIRCSLLPWPIEIYPASHSSVVTVGDVLEGMYCELRRHVSGDEWNRAFDDTRERVRQSWLRRCKRQQTHKDREYETNNGLRRIDWLSKDTMFQGLSPGKSRDTWILHLRQGEKTVKFWAGS